MVPLDTAAHASAAGSLVTRDELHERLSGTPAGGVAVICAPAGSGKSVLLRSWLKTVGERTAWVSVRRGEEDAQRFWLAVVDALVRATASHGWVERISPSPSFRGDAVVEQLLSDVAEVDGSLVLVIDDVHELRSPEALELLEMFLGRLPPTLRVALGTREEPALGLHRLRLTNALVELRAEDLRFSVAQTRDLLTASGIELSDAGLARLHERTEGWAAGLRLAALSLTGHPDPERFVAEFSGSERTVASYLLAEVLERQGPGVRTMLLRTAVLERVSGPLADALTESTGSERILQSLADANAFVTPLDVGRVWFRYHHLFADFLRLELRRTAPELEPVLHSAAACWFDAHGEILDAVRHAQAAGDWPVAMRLLGDRYLDLLLDGSMATVRSLLAAFPDQVLEAHAELPVMVAGARLYEGAHDAAAAHLEDARRLASAVPDERRPAYDLLHATMALWLASRRGDLAAATEAARAVETAAGAQTGSGIARRDQHRAAALLNLGTTEIWTQQPADARRHLEHAVARSRRIGQPYLEVAALAFLAVLATMGEGPAGAARTLADQAVAIVGEHGWSLDPIGAPAFIASAETLVWAGRFEEGEHELERARRAVPAAGEPNTEIILDWALGLLRLAQGRPQDALAAFRTAEQLQARFAERHPFTADVRSRVVLTRLQLGGAGAARAELAELDDTARAAAATHVAAAAVELAEDRPERALAELAPVVADAARTRHPRRVIVEALLYAALAHDALGDRRAVEDALESALEAAESEGLVLPFVIVPVIELLERHRGHRTAHATLLSDVLDVLAGTAPRSTGDVKPLREDLSAAELRVVRYLPTNLTAPQIASELIVSPNTVGTHLRHIYAKLDVHSRSEAVARARGLGLLAPSLRVR